MISFKVISLNVRGLRANKKRQKIFHWMAEHGGRDGVVFLQEVHCTPEVKDIWSMQWKGESYFSFGTNQSKGVMILIGQNVEYKIKKIKADNGGRMLILNCEIQGQNFVFINIYAPNTEIEQVEFF